MIEAARADGRLPNDDAIAFVSRSRVEGGPGDGMEVLDVRMWGGFDLRILPDRGLDIGQVWYRGVPLAWVSRVGETRPLRDLEDRDWSRGFGGGLMVTCGLRNVGMPSEGHGLHGTYSHLPASDVVAARDIDGDRLLVTVEGLVTDEGHPDVLRLARSIRTWTGSGLIEVTDRLTNLGSRTTETPILYHFNFGYPLWGPGALLDLDVTGTIPRDEASRPALDSWSRLPPVEDVPERVLEHVVIANEGWAEATVANRDLGVGVKISWRVAELPRLHQWIDPSPGMYVLGIEPANCSTEGRGVDRVDGRLPMLEAGEIRETALEVRAFQL